MSTSACSTPVLGEIVNALQKIAPVELGASWDNVGLLVDHVDGESAPVSRVLLTNDLTARVLEEAIREQVQLIITYHPTPFRPVKKITRETFVGKLILQCVTHGIAVYSPHTASDSSVGGVNDWLASGLGKGQCTPLQPTELLEHEGAGEGRYLKLATKTSLAQMISRVKTHLKLEFVRVAVAFDQLGETRADKLPLDDVEISNIGLCAGSGSSVLKGCDADLWLTGELSHHDILAANAAGTNVIITDHTNSERGYLPEFGAKLEDVLNQMRNDDQGEVEFEIIVSEVDCDPLHVI